MKYVDIHAHLTFKDFDADRDDVIARMKENNVSALNVGVDGESSQAIVDLAHKHDILFAVVGLHPLYVCECETQEDIQKAVAELAYLITSSSKVVGIGECGLDFFRLKGETEEEKNKEKELQEYAFRLQIELALSLNKPLMIHCRNAYPEVLAILAEYKKVHAEKLRVNFHFFAGTKDELAIILDLGFYVSFTGVVTFAKEYVDIVQAVPLDRMMSETDCPYVAPVPHRGKRNEPIFVIEIVKKLAEIKGISEEEMAAHLLENTKQFFIDFS